MPPLFKLYSYPLPDPPLAKMVIVPSVSPKQVTSVLVNVKVTAVGSVTVSDRVAVQPFSSVTVTS